jgi:hypothetical protein
LPDEFEERLKMKKALWSLTELAETAEFGFFVGRETPDRQKHSPTLNKKEGCSDEFLLWRPSLPEQKIILSVNPVNSSEASERNMMAQLVT